MRRFVRIILCLLAILVIALLTLPWWLSLPLRPILARNGVTYASYSSGGYSRFILTDVRVTTPAADVTAARLEIDTPLLFLIRRAISKPGPVTIDTCTVTLKPTPPAAAQTPNSATPTGVLPTRDLVNKLRDQIAPWLPALQLTNGEIRLSPADTAPIKIASVALAQDATDTKITIAAVSYRERIADASLVLNATSTAFRATLDKPQSQLSLTLTGDQVLGTVQAFDQTAALAARFAPEGWLPLNALLEAPNLSLDATQLAAIKLPHYTTATGRALIKYENASFTADIDARASAHSETKTPQSEIDIVLRAQGTPEKIDITALNLAVPGLTARLSAPVTITRDLRILSGNSRFTLDADLAQQPWFPATGRITGEIALAPDIENSAFRNPNSAFGTLRATARLAAENIRVEDIAITRLTLDLAQENLVTRLNVLDLALPQGTRITASSQYDAGHRTFGKTTLNARILPADVARFLPPEITFDDATLALTGSGPDTAPDHNGTLEIKNARLPALVNPANLSVAWNGRLIDIASLNLALTTATTDLTLSATASGNSAIRNPNSAFSATLTALTLRKDNADRLVLTAPATFTRTAENTFTLTSLALASPDSVSKLSLQASLEKNTASLALSAAGIDSTLLADLVNPGPLPWQLARAEITATLPSPDAPLSASVALDARVDFPVAATGLPKPHTAFVAATATLIPGALVIENISISEREHPIARIIGRLPISIHPAAAPALRTDETGPVAFTAHTDPASPFWQNLAAATGITLENPRFDIHVEGTMQKPAATADIGAARIAFDQALWPKHFPKLPELPPLPPLTELAAHLVSDGKTLDLSAFQLRIAGQPVNATAHATLGKTLAPKLQTLNLTTEADLAALAPYSANTLASRGNLALKLSISENEKITGSLRLRDAALRPIAPLGIIGNINADARLEGRRLEIITATAQIGSQPATVTGSVEFPDNSALRTAHPAFLPNLSVKATNIPFVRQPGMLVRGDIDIGIQTTDTKIGAVPVIKGTVTLRDSLFLADIRSLWGKRPASGPASRPPFFAIDTPPLDAWQLDVSIRGPQFLRVDTTVFNGKLSAAFKLDGTLGDPRLIGDATIDSGKVLLPFATFTTQSGRVRLTQATPHMPTIEFAATSRTLGYDLRMEIDGTAENPRLKFTSSPALTSEQILLFVMTGEAPDNEVDYTNQQRALSLGTYLGQSFVNELLGLSSEEGRLTLTSGEKLTRQGRETYNVEYKLTDRWSGVGEYDEFDAYNLGIKWLAYRSKPAGAPATAAAAKPAPEKAESKDKEKTSPPKIKVAGRGFFKNLSQKRMLQRTLALGEKHAPSLTANEVEDAAFLLVSQLVESGYMHPKLTLAATPAEAGGRSSATPQNPAATASQSSALQTFTTDESLNLELPRELAAKELNIQITPGKRYKLRDVTFTGKRTITDDDARQFFLPSAGLLGDPSIPYSPDTLKSCLAALQSTLKQQGYAEATATISDLKIDDATGRVTAQITINEGPLWKIEKITTALPPGANNADIQVLDGMLFHEFYAKPWSQWTQQDIAERIRQHYYKLGHPDVTVQIAHTPADTSQPDRAVAVQVTIDPGLEVRIAHITLKGNRYTRESLVRRRIGLKSGDLLNPLALEAARHRLSSLGTFRTIDLDYAPADGPLRDARFSLVEMPRTDVSLLLGWGSYEQLRGGIELRRLNTFGIADQTRLQAIQSMKSSRGDLTFAVPDLFTRGVNGSIRVYGLRREEVAFERIEYGGAATLRKGWAARGYETSVGYTYESLNSTDDTLSPDAGETGRTIAAAFNLSLTRDKRDNPLSPKRGYNWYLQGELASHYLGGDADYQRYRAGFVYHTAWGRTRWIHAGLSQGFILPIGSKDTPLPVNKLFYPGGENSIRGYQDGEAAPRDENGAFLGAKVYTLLNLEIEQSLVGSLNFVVFYDLLGDSANMRDYPGSEWLNSAGIGFRYHTILGPIRLEYGRNLNPRAGDPKGTLHFSVGIPF